MEVQTVPQPLGPHDRADGLRGPAVEPHGDQVLHLDAIAGRQFVEQLPFVGIAVRRWQTLLGARPLRPASRVPATQLCPCTNEKAIRHTPIGARRALHFLGVDPRHQPPQSAADLLDRMLRSWRRMALNDGALALFSRIHSRANWPVCESRRGSCFISALVSAVMIRGPRV